MAPPFQLQLQVSDDGLQWLIARGLADDALPASKEPAPSWPPEGPKVGTGWDFEHGDSTGFIQAKWRFNGIFIQPKWWFNLI